MKSELSLVQLAQELERQQYAKKDYLVTETAMEARTVTDDGGVPTVVLGIDQVGEYTLTPHAHGQLGTYLQIPKPNSGKVTLRAKKGYHGQPELLLSSGEPHENPEVIICRSTYHLPSRVAQLSLLR